MDHARAAQCRAGPLESCRLAEVNHMVSHTCQAGEPSCEHLYDDLRRPALPHEHVFVTHLEVHIALWQQSVSTCRMLKQSLRTSDQRKYPDACSLQNRPRTRVIPDQHPQIRHQKARDVIHGSADVDRPPRDRRVQAERLQPPQRFLPRGLSLCPALGVPAPTRRSQSGRLRQHDLIHSAQSRAQQPPCR